jgi:FKBP-type peptidyl-prolyl cis-trans isomerase 2
MVMLSLIGLSASGFALASAKASFQTGAQMGATMVQDVPVLAGATVTVWLHIRPLDNPDEAYIDIEQFIQGQHTVPKGIESRVAGMHAGEIKTFPLSAEEGFGPRDETKIQTIPTTDLPPDSHEGDTLADDAGRYGRIILIRPELTVIDFNHPLAGLPLLITLQVVTIEDTDERERTEGQSALLLYRILGPPHPEHLSGS